MDLSSQDDGGGGKCQRLIWNNENLEKAIEAVSSKNMSISAASKMFMVPRRILEDCIKGCVEHARKPGISTALTLKKENLSSSILSKLSNDFFYIILVL